MKSNKERIFDYIKEHQMNNGDSEGVSTKELSEKLDIKRPNVSALLNELVAESELVKGTGRPVLYKLRDISLHINHDPFADIIGGSDGSFKNAITLAKAATIYPDQSMKMIITGEVGVGKTGFVKKTYEYAKSIGKIKNDAPFVKMNCRYYSGSSESIYDVLFKESEPGKPSLFEKSIGGFLFLDEVDYLPPHAMRRVLHYINNDEYYDAKTKTYHQADITLVVASNKKRTNAIVDTFIKNIPVVIELPPYRDRSFKEAFELISYFYRIEAMKTNRVIEVSSEVIHSLLLYSPNANSKQLKNDIKIGCARGFVKEINSPHNKITVKLSDMPHAVQQCFWKYGQYKDEVNDVAPKHHTYSFTKEKLNIAEIADTDKGDYNIYSAIDERVDTLAKSGVQDDQIPELLGNEVNKMFAKYSYYLDSEQVNRDELSKVVDSEIIDVVEIFLNKASLELGVEYPASLYYGLAIHVGMIEQRQDDKAVLTDKQISEIMGKHKKEYEFAAANINLLEKVIGISLPIDEIVFTTIFLTQYIDSAPNEPKPNILVVMHGESTASSVAEAVNALVKLDNIYSFNLNLDVPIDKAFKLLKEEVIKIDNGTGLIVIYDMGSIKTMCDMIATQTGVALRLVQIPLTLIALECSRQASLENDIDTLYHSVINEELDVMKKYVEVEQSRKKNAIVVLCTTGEGAAEQIKKYLTQHLNTDKYAVIPVANYSRRKLRDSIKEINRTYNIKAIVGATDPMLGYPYVSFGDVLQNKDNLDAVFNFEIIASANITIEEINHYLSEYLKAIDMDEDSKPVAKVVTEISEAYNLAQEQELALYIHLLSNINRILVKAPLISNPDRDETIEKYEDDFKFILKTMAVLEKYFDIIFTDDDISVIVKVLKED